MRRARLQQLLDRREIWTPNGSGANVVWHEGQVRSVCSGAIWRQVPRNVPLGHVTAALLVPRQDKVKVLRLESDDSFQAQIKQREQAHTDQTV
jgi:hypothetical protein